MEQALEGYFRAMVPRTWTDNVLFFVLVELTYRCNLDCVFCYNDVKLRGKKLLRDDYLKFFEDLRDLGVLNLTLSGGEPLAHPDFFTLGRAAREMGFLVRVKSNGHALGGELARRLREEVAPFMVEVSLHGARAETHDRQTRVPGSFDRLMINLQGLRTLGQRFKINSVLTAFNEDEFEGMYALADSLGAQLQMDTEVTPRDDGDKSPLQLAASDGAIRRLARFQFAVASAQSRAAGTKASPASTEPPPKPGSKYCGAGAAGIAVDPFGNVYPCVAWRQPVGNLHQTRIGEIWKASPVLAQIRQANVQVRDTLTKEGLDGGLMNFCPGLAAKTTGSPAGVYAGAERRARLFREAQESG